MTLEPSTSSSPTTTRSRTTDPAPVSGKPILIFSELYYPEDTSTGFFLTGIAEGLAQEIGVSIRVYCSQPSYRLKGQKANSAEVRKGVEISRSKIPILNKNRLWGKAWNSIAVTLALGMKGLRIKRGDQVMVVTNPPFLPLLIALACRARGGKFSLLVHDVYPDVLVSTGLLRKSSFICRGIATVQRWIYQGASQIIVLGRDMEALIAQKVNSAVPISIIPNWGEAELVHPRFRKNNSLRSRLQLENKFLVQFSGNIGRTHGVDELLEAANAFSEDVSVHFLIFGWGAGKKRLEDGIRELNLQNVTLLDPCSRDELGTYLTACDVSLVLMKAGMAGVSVPSRLYNILAAGNPIIAMTDDHSEIAHVVREEEIGWTCLPGQIEELIDAIKTAQSDPTLLQKGANARRAFEEKYTYERVIEAYRNVFSGESALE